MEILSVRIFWYNVHKYILDQSAENNDIRTLKVMTKPTSFYYFSKQ